MMTQVYWRLVEILSRMLEDGERQVVHGDLAESGVAGSQALRAVLGLVVRRQAALWTNWQPWLTLSGLVIPLGIVLSGVSRDTANGSAIYIWMYANNWEWGDLSNPGFWHVLAETFVMVFMSNLTLVCWSWTCGFVLGSVSRGMLRINSVLFCLMLLFGGLVGAPLYIAWSRHLFGFRSLPIDPNAPVFALPFYREMFPLIVQAFMVVIPSMWGMRQGVRMESFGPLLRTILWTAAIATLGLMVIQTPEVWLFLQVNGLRGILDGWQARLVQVIVYWPVGYMVTSAIVGQWQGRVAPI